MRADGAWKAAESMLCNKTVILIAFASWSTGEEPCVSPEDKQLSSLRPDREDATPAIKGQRTTKVPSDGVADQQKETEEW